MTLSPVMHEDPADRELYIIVWGAYAKIGCSVDPIERLTRVTGRGLRPPRQSGNPELVATVPGGFGAEAWMHAVLSGHRANGEWFHLRGPVADLVAAARAKAEERPLPARTRRLTVAPRPGKPLITAYTGRALRAEVEDRVRHAINGGTAAGGRALCGTKIAAVGAAWNPDHTRVCGDCRRLALPD